MTFMDGRAVASRGADFVTTLADGSSAEVFIPSNLPSPGRLALPPFPEGVAKGDRWDSATLLRSGAIARSALLDLAYSGWSSEVGESRRAVSVSPSSRLSIAGPAGSGPQGQAMDGLRWPRGWTRRPTPGRAEKRRNQRDDRGGIFSSLFVAVDKKGLGPMGGGPKPAGRQPCPCVWQSGKDGDWLFGNTDRVAAIRGAIFRRRSRICRRRSLPDLTLFGCKFVDSDQLSLSGSLNSPAIRLT